MLEELLQISDQLAQITKLMDVHWASALAIALRKVGCDFYYTIGLCLLTRSVEWELRSTNCRPRRRPRKDWAT